MEVPRTKSANTKVKPKVIKAAGRATSRTLGGSGPLPEYFGAPPRSSTFYG